MPRTRLGSNSRVVRSPASRATACTIVRRLSTAAAEAVQSLRTIVQAVAREAGDRTTLEFDPSLVRGMGYYTGPIFEAVYGGGTSAIAGGGRYDRMVGRLLGHDVPACGFSIGFERVVSILEERGGSAG